MSSLFKWSPDIAAEQIMKRLGLSWKVEEVLLSDIDWKKSRDNHSRRTGDTGVTIDDDHVTGLALAMLQGDALPMPVFVLPESGKLIILSGNHRCPAAKEAEATSVTGYVLRTNDDVVLDALPRALNVPVREVSRADRIAQAIHMAEIGMDVLLASETFYVPVSTIRKGLLLHQTLKRIGEWKIPGSEKIPSTSIMFLKSIKNDNVLRAAVQSIASTGMMHSDIESLVRDVRDGRTEAQMMSAIAVHERGRPIQATSIPQKTRSAAAIFKTSLTNMEHAARAKSLNHVGITDRAEKLTYVDRIKKLCHSLSVLCTRSLYKGT